MYFELTRVMTHKLFVFITKDIFRYFFLEFSLSSVKLLSHITSILSQLPDLCSPSASVVCLPTIVFLSTTVLKYIAVGLEETFQNVSELKLALEKIIRSFKKVITSEHGRNELCVESWEKIIQRYFHSVYKSFCVVVYRF